MGLLAGWMSDRYIRSISVRKNPIRNKYAKCVDKTVSVMLLPPLFLIVYIRENLNEFLLYSFMFTLLIIAAETDRRYGIIPNTLIILGLLFILIWSLVYNTSKLQLYPVLAIMGTLLIFRQVGYVLRGRPGLGMGDVKLFGIIAMFIGWQSFVILYLACLLLLFSVIVNMVISKNMPSPRQEIPMAPWIAISGLVEYLLISHYYHHIYDIIII